MVWSLGTGTPGHLDGASTCIVGAWISIRPELALPGPPVEHTGLPVRRSGGGPQSRYTAPVYRMYTYCDCVPIVARLPQAINPGQATRTSRAGSVGCRQSSMSLLPSLLSYRLLSRTPTELHITFPPFLPFLVSGIAEVRKVGLRGSVLMNLPVVTRKVPRETSDLALLALRWRCAR
jgi:hypothetical protein